MACNVFYSNFDFKIFPKANFHEEYIMFGSVFGDFDRPTPKITNLPSTGQNYALSPSQIQLKIGCRNVTASDRVNQEKTLFTELTD